MVNTSLNCRGLARFRNCLPLELMNVIYLHKQALHLHFDVSGYSVILNQNMHIPNISVADTNFPSSPPNLLNHPLKGSNEFIFLVWGFTFI